MEIYVTPEGQIRTSLSFPSYLNLSSSFLKTKRDTLEKLDVFFVSGTDVSRKAVGTNVVVTVKPLSQWDAEAVFVGSTAEYPTTEDSPYGVDLAISSESIDQSLFVDGDTGNDVEYVDFMLEIAYSESGGGFSALDWRKSDNVLFRVYNDVNRNDAIPKSPAFGHVLVEDVNSSGVLYVTGDPASGGTITIGGSVITYTVDGGPSFGVNSIDANSGNAIIDVSTFCNAVKEFINNEVSTQVGWSFSGRNFNAPVIASNTANTVQVQANSGGVIGDSIATLESLTNATWGGVTLSGGADTVYSTKDNWVSDFPQTRDSSSKLQARINIGAASQAELDSLADSKDLEAMDTGRAYEVGEAFYWTDNNNYRTDIASGIGVTPDTNPENFSILGVKSSIYTSDGVLTSDREIDLGGNSIHFINGTNFTIDGAVFTADSVEPTSVEFGSIQIDADVDNDSMFLTDGSDSGFVAGTLSYKNSAGAYFNMEQNSMSGADIKVAYENEVDTNAFTDTEKTKLATIQSNANVNVNADWNGSGDDSEILNKPILGTASQAETGDFATSAQGDLADTLSTTKQDILTEGAFVDGDKTKLDAVTGANTGDQDLSGLQVKPAEGAFVDGDKTKLDSALQPADPTLESVTTNGATTTNDIQVGTIATLHPTNTANDNTATGTQSASIGGRSNTASGTRATTFGGRDNTVSGNDSTAVGGNNQNVRGVEAEGFGSTNTTLNTKYTTAIGTANSVVGLATSADSSVDAKHSAIMGGESHTIENAQCSVILGGDTNKIQTNHLRSVVLGGQNIITDAADTAYVQNLNVKSAVKIPTGAADTYVLTSDANGVGTWQAAGGGGGGGGGTVQNANLSIEPTDDGTVAGDARGANSVDLQTTRNLATQVASGWGSAITGGVNSTVSDGYSTISGGYHNTISGYGYAVIGGGVENVINGSDNNNLLGGAVIAGGAGNTASSDYSTIGGGASNTNSGYRGTISGGYMNTVSNYDSTVGGGNSNTATGNYSTVSGGNDNTASNYYAAVGGGYGNQASGITSVVCGGGGVATGNTASGDYSAVLGGRNNSTNSLADAMIAGSQITATDANTLHCNNLKIENGGFKMPTGATDTYVLTTDANGVGTWQAAAGGGGGGGGGGGTVQGTDSTYQIEATATDNTTTPNANGAYSVNLQTHTQGAATQTASGGHSLIGGGKNNTASSQYGVVSGGEANTASGYSGSVVGGGAFNNASASNSTVSGGKENTASADYSAVSGGLRNTASSRSATLGGGEDNTASGNYSTISGGQYNIAAGNFGTVSGGYSNTASGYRSTVSGGYMNIASGDYSAVLGGRNNSTNSLADAVIAGSSITATEANTLHCNNLKIENGGFKMPTGATDTYVLTTDANGVGTWQAGGGGGGGGGGTVQGTDSTYDIRATLEGTLAGNSRGQHSVDLQTIRTLATQVAAADSSIISGGVDNRIESFSTGSTIGGGRANTITGVNGSESTISGGYGNTCTDGYQQTISGGYSNTASGYYGTVSGGYKNTSSGNSSIVAGGFTNTASAHYSTVSGGWTNTSSAYYSTVSGGYQNTASGQYATVSGGQGNTASVYHTTIGGGSYNAASGDYSTVSGGDSNTASGDYSAVLGGRSNSTNSLASAMIVGSQITAQRANTLHCNNLTIKNIPTSATGLTAGDVWNDAGTLKIV